MPAAPSPRSRSAYGRLTQRIALLVTPLTLVGGFQQPVFAAPVKPSKPPAVQRTQAVRAGALAAEARTAGTPSAQPKAPVWPSAAVVELDLTKTPTATATVGGMAVTAAGAPAPAGRSLGSADAVPGRIRLQVLDRQAAARAGVAGAMVAVGRADGRPTTGSVRLTMAYAGFAGAFGGDYGARLRWVSLPQCALSTPDRAECRTRTRVATQNDTGARTLSATVDAAAIGMSVLAAEAEEESSQGDFAATKLSPSAKWEVSLSSGAMSWSYPIRTPLTPGDLGPQVTLSYSSQTVDGRTSGTNNQGSWIGEGFSYEPGYVERRYKPCADDGHEGYGDQCWAFPNATIVLGGRAGDLVRITDDLWKLSTDDGTKVERLTGAVNGDDNGEHWKATTTDGTEYFFGLNQLPGWSATKEETASTWTARVSGDDVNEPCYRSSGWKDSFCDQGWRWNLDYVRDRSGNVVSYYYSKELNNYAEAARTDVNGKQYVRGGWLKRVDYGQRDGAVYTTNAPARVRFDTAERCVAQGTITCAESELNDDTAYSRPDVPWDRNCAANTHCKITQASQTFWTRQRLTAITTEVRSGSSWTPVEKWDLRHTFTDNGDGSKTLWLDKIDHTGLLGGTVTMPSTQLVGIQLPNRVDSPTDMLAPLNRYRLSAVFTDSGGKLQVNYTPAECTPNALPAEGSSVQRCFPVKWNPFGTEQPLTDWFHKYLVAQTIELDRTGGNPEMVTQYEYGVAAPGDQDPVDGAGWRKAPADGITKDEYRTWSVWRGYPKVTVRRGDMATLTTREEHYFLRGLDGDAQPGGGNRIVKATDSTGAVYTDSDEFSGHELETISYNGAAIVSKTITAPKLWFTHTQTETWGTLRAFVVKPETTRAFTALAPDAQGNPQWREIRTVVTYDSTWGRPVQAHDLGVPGDPSDDRCTRVAYADNAGLYMYTFRKLVEKFAASCDVANPDRATQLLESDRTSYDGLAYGVAPTKGKATREEKLDTVDAATTTYTKTETVVDTFGRPTKVTDARNNSTTTLYTDVDGLNTQRKATDAAGLITIVNYQPGYGSETSRVDANGYRTDMEYDPLGRLARVWLPTRPKAAGNTPNIRYTYLFPPDKPVVTKTETIRNDGTYRPSYELFDGLLRSRQTQIQGADGGWLISDTIYTATGAKATVNAPYLVLGTPGDQVLVVPEGAVNGQTKYEYDGAGREIAEITAVAGDERWRKTTAYGGDRTWIDPPTGGTPTMVVTDARGHRSEVHQFHGDAPSGPADVSRYVYTPEGRLKSITGPDGSVWEYDQYQNGRERSVVDPDTGRTTYTYDKNGNLTSRADSRGVTLSYVYDKLNRKTEEWSGAPVTGTRLAGWVFDTFTKGQLAGTVRYTTAGTYYVTFPLRDGQNRVLKTSYVIPAQAGAELARTYDVTTSYNIDGTMQTLGMPEAGDLAAESITIGYDDLQRASTLTGSSTYVTGVQYSGTGHLLQMTLRSGAGKAVWQTIGYERGTGRMLSSRIDREDAAAVDMDAHYSYDDAANVLSISDTPAGGERDVQCFTYDHLHRLKEAWSTANADTDPCAGGDAAASGVGGPAAYHQKWTFRTGGDRDTETLYSTTGGPETTRTYVYPAAGVAQPHTLRRVDQAVGGTTNTFEYLPDQAGNTRSRPGAAGQQILGWDPEGKLASVEENGLTTSYVYDADGNRLMRKDTNATTIYIGSMELRLDHTTRAVTGTRFYAFGGQTIASRKGAGLSFQAADPHGSAVCSINAQTGAITWRRLTPYGAIRGQAPAAWPDERGFLGATTDATGLIHIGAREYDPALGRFVSVDPDFDEDDPQSWNGFAYARNSPVSLSDPTGLRVMEDSDGGRPWYTLEHNAAVLACYAKIQSEIIRRGGDRTKLFVELPLPGGSFKKPGSGNLGRADIVYITDTTIFVWEVKAVGQGDELAQITIDHYAPFLLQKHGTGPGGIQRVVEPGFPMGGFAVGYVPGAPNGNYVVAFDGKSPGTLLYQRFKGFQREPQPEPTRVPDPKPLPTPVPIPQPRVVTPTVQPTPGIPQPSPNPWGPYGFPLPACGGGIGCIPVEVWFLGGIVAIAVVVVAGPEVVAAAGAIAAAEGIRRLATA